MAWKTFEDAKKFAFEKGFAFVVMFGDQPIEVMKYENIAKAKAKMWRDHDHTPNVSVKRFNFDNYNSES